jgi:hypothetical protein
MHELLRDSVTTMYALNWANCHDPKLLGSAGNFAPAWRSICSHRECTQKASPKSLNAMGSEVEAAMQIS